MTTLEITTEYDRRMEGRCPSESRTVCIEIAEAYDLDVQAVKDIVLDHLAGEIGG